MYTSSGLAYYRHSDWLGSSRFASTPSRTKYFDVAYAPYGEDYADSGTVDLNFTGQNQDTVSGMYDFMYREYHANSGRWIQPDPAGPAAANLGNPQTWNRYAYVGNIPLTAVDPLGLFTHWSDVFGTARMGGIDPLRDPGGAWLADQLQQFMADAGLLSPMQQGFGTYLGSIYGSGKVRFNDGGWQAYTPYPDWTSDNGFTIHTGNGRWVSMPGMPTAASNGNFSWYGILSWINKGLDYLKTHPVTISVNEILAGQITYQASTKTICGNVGLGASVPPTKAVTVGILNEGDMGKWTDVVGSWGYSFGANLFLGYQGSFNSSGKVGGPTVSGIGLSGSYTYGGCTTVP